MLHKIRIAPLCSELNEAILKVTNDVLPDGYDISDYAPNTFAQLVGHLNSGKKMVVYGKDLNNDIYANKQVSLSMRAWHDWCHYVGNYNFTVQGEEQTWELMCRQLERKYGINKKTQRWREILRIEVVEQRLFYQKYRTYVADQSSFVSACL